MAIVELSMPIEQVRESVLNGATIPNSTIYFKMNDNINPDTLCDARLGDENDTYINQFYISEIDGIFYIVPGRKGKSKIKKLKNKPTGNHITISDEEFAVWVELFGAENLYTPDILKSIIE